MNDAMTCKCNRCPAHRMARGLQPFCQMASKGPRDRSGEFGSYTAACAARQPGQRVLSTTVTGGPKRFVLVAA